MRELRWPLVIGLGLRYVLAPFTSWQHDVAVWLGASESGAHHIGLYTRLGFSYPPGWGDLLQGIGLVLSKVGEPTNAFAERSAALSPLANLNHVALYVTAPWFNVAYKSMLFAFDLGTALLVAAFVTDITSDPKRYRLAFSLVFLNPLVIFTSAVLGWFDIMVGFSILLGVYAVFKQRYALAGAALGLGIVAKLSPVFVMPLILCAVVLHSRESADRRRLPAWLWACASFCGGAAVIGVTSLVPVVASHGLSAMLQTTTAREGSVVGTSGFSIYGLSVFKGTTALYRWVSENASLAHTINNLAPIPVLVLGVVQLVRKGLTERRLILFVAATLSMILLTAIQTQPWYVLWVLPLVVVLYVAWGRSKTVLGVMSIAPVVSTVFVYGPAYLLFPLGTYTSVVSLDWVVQHVASWMAIPAPGIWTFSQRQTIPSVLLLLMLLSWGALVVQALRSGASIGAGGPGPGRVPRPAEATETHVASACQLGHGASPKGLSRSFLAVSSRVFRILRALKRSGSVSALAPGEIAIGAPAETAGTMQPESLDEGGRTPQFRRTAGPPRPVELAKRSILQRGRISRRAGPPPPVGTGETTTSATGEPASSEDRELAERATAVRAQLATHWAYGLLAATLAASLLVTAAVGSGTSSGSVSLLSSSVSGGRLRLDLRFTPGPGEQSLRVVSFPLRHRPVPIRRIFVFYDSSYPELHALPGVASTIGHHLANELKMRGYHVPVSTVDANHLSAVFRDTKAAPGLAVVDVTGLLPSSSFGRRVDLVRPWVRAGGLLVWSGAAIGGYGVTRSATSHAWRIVRTPAKCRILCLPHATPPRCPGVSPRGRCGQIEGLSSNTVAPDPSSLASALELSYRITSPPDGLLGNSSKGRRIGWVGRDESSITSHAVGKGTVVVFAGLVGENTNSTTDIIFILESNAYCIAGPVSVTNVLASHVSPDGRLTLTFPNFHNNKAQLFQVFAFDPNLFGTLTRSFTIHS